MDNNKYNNTKKRCFLCKSKVPLTIINGCRCGNIYCYKHLNTFDHNCTYDYTKNNLIINDIKIEPRKINKI